MDRQSEPPGPEIGWAFGGIGFVATVFVGWLMDAGVGFGLFAGVFWFGIGSLFAFLVERSTIEENDRHDELQNTRLATLAPVVEPPAPREDHRRDGGSSPRPVPRAPAPDPGVASRAAGDVPAAAPASVAPAPRPRRDRVRTPAPVVTASPRAYREAAAEASAARNGDGRDRPAYATYRAPDAPPRPADPRDRRPRPERGPAAGPPRRGGGEHHERSTAPRPQPRSPREYREARAEAERRGHAAA